MKPLDKKIWWGLLILALLSPLGIILPEKFQSGEAWGEWGVETLEKVLGYVPSGLKKLTDLWKAPIPSYNLGGEGASLSEQVLWYLVSAVLGMGIVVSVIYLLSKFLKNNEK